MAIRDPRDRSFIPRIIAQPPNTQRYELKIHTIAPEDIDPLGDRYVVEIIDFDEKIELGSILVVTQQPPQDNSPQADPTIERRGVLAAVVIRAGNGHLLGLSDHPWSDSKDEDERDWASVPMFYQPGDVLFIDHNAKGRALKIVGRECRIVNQIDCLARVEGVRLKRVDGEWVQE